MDQLQDKGKYYIEVIITEATQVRTAASMFILITAESMQPLVAVIELLPWQVI